MAYPPDYMKELVGYFYKKHGRVPSSKAELLEWWDIEDPVSMIMAQSPGINEDEVRQYVIDEHMRRKRQSGAPPLVASHTPSTVGTAGREWTNINEQGTGGRMSTLPGVPGNASALALLSRRPGGGGYEGIPDSGGPEDMVRAAIMKELRYLLAPDVSAEPMTPDEYWSGKVAVEYPDLKFDTPLSNPRVAEAIGPLMEMYAGVGRARQQEQMGEQELSSARTREAYTQAQADALRRGGNIKAGAAMDAAKALDRTNRWLMAFEQRLKQAAGGLVIDPQLGEKSSEEAMQIAQQIKQNVQNAQELVQRAIELENQGNNADAAYYAQQAVALLSKYDKLTQEGGMQGTPTGGDRVGRAIAGL